MLETGIMTARGFLDRSDSSVKWRRLLRAWVPIVSQEARWYWNLCHIQGMCDRVRGLLCDVLRDFLRDEGLRCVTWNPRELTVCPDDSIVAGQHIGTYCAGSYPLYKWMRVNGQRPSWRPKDIDIFFVYARQPPTNGEWSVAERLYWQQCRAWLSAFKTKVLKEETDDGTWGAIRELNRHSLSVPPGRDARYGPRREENERTAYDKNDDQSPSMIYQIKDYEIAFRCHDSTFEQVAIFSFILWRDYTTDEPTIQHVFDSFDMNVCQVGIAPHIDGSVTAFDGTVLALAPCTQRIAQDIANLRARTVKKTPKRKERKQKYRDRGFEFDSHDSTPSIRTPS